MKLWTIIIMTSLLGLSCAKKREVEKVQALDASRWEKSVFDNSQDWLYKVTVVNNGANAKLGFIGLQSDLKMGKFRFTESRLEFISSTDVYGDGDSTAKVINSWGGQHSDYHRATVGGKVSNRESENNEISWDEKSFFIIDWTQATIEERNTLAYGMSSRCYNKKNSRLIKDTEEITNEHISFTLAVDYELDNRCVDQYDYLSGEKLLTVHFKYSFIPDPKTDYKPYVYTGEVDPLMKKYGYFNTSVLGVGSNNRLNNTFLMNRWDPEKTHTFYFAEDFPEQYKWIYNDPKTGVMAKTNEIFEKEGIKTRFEIKDNDGSKKFGDLRYSFIKFIDQPERAAPLGYGPSDAHPVTGEIISANSMMWTAQLKHYAGRYQEDLEYYKNQATSSSIYREMANILGDGPTNWSQTSAFLEEPNSAAYYRFLIPEFTYSSPGNLFTLGRENEAQLFPKESFDNAKKELGPTADITPQVSSSESVIREELNRYAESMTAHYNSHTVFKMTEEIFGGAGTSFQADVSSEKVINDILYRVSIHEFGHNLNLRHNFYGSVDARINRIRGEDLSLKRSSSVMDYLGISDEVGLAYDWEDYDKAALVYAYSNGAIDVSKKTGITHLYCTDDHRYYNPMCNAFDQGATPTEIISSMISRYDGNYRRINFRYDRAFWNSWGYSNYAFGTMWDIKKMVKLYQETFLPSQVAAEMQGLDFLSPTFKANLTGLIRADITEAVKLAAAFYSSVIKQSQLDRDFSNTYDEFTGQVKQLGIYPDKEYAQYFLMGDASFPLNPNFGSIPVSFINLRSDAQIGTFIDNILLDSFVNAGPSPYNSFDDIGRYYYSVNASRYFDFEGEQGAIDLMKIECYEEDSFLAKFGVDSSTLNPGFNTLTPDYGSLANPDSYFKDEPQVVAAEINNKVYVSGTTLNKYAAGIFQINDLNGILNTYRFYKSRTSGEVERCL